MAEMIMGDYELKGAVSKILAPIYKEQLRRAAYELYKAVWLERYTTMSQQTDKRLGYIDNLIENIGRTSATRYSLEDYLYDVGYDSVIYCNYDQFLTYLYPDKAYMSALFRDEHQYQFYKEHDDLFATK